MLQGLPGPTHRDLLLSVGSHRGTRPLSPTEVASALKAATDAGTPTKDLAAALHLNGSSMITRFVRLLDLPAPILHLVDWGQTQATITFTSASELSRLRSRNDQAALSASALELGLTSSEVKAIVQLRQRSKKHIAECTKEIVNLRTEVVRRNIFIGAVTAPEVRAHLTTLHQVDRDRLLAGVINQLLPGSAGISARLGHDRFTLGTEDKAVVDQIISLPGGFEEAVNVALAGSVEVANPQ